MLTYRKKHLCMSLKSQLCEVENRCRCFPTNLTTAPLLSSALSHCHRAPACVSLHFLALCCAVFPAITCSCISRIWYIYIFTLRKLPSSLRCSFQVTILQHFLLIARACQQSFCMSLCPFFFFFFQMGSINLELETQYLSSRVFLLEVTSVLSQTILN